MMKVASSSVPALCSKFFESSISDRRMHQHHLWQQIRTNRLWNTYIARVRIVCPTNSMQKPTKTNSQLPTHQNKLNAKASKPVGTFHRRKQPPFYDILRNTAAKQVKQRQNSHRVVQYAPCPKSNGEVRRVIDEKRIC
jgi:hypothetical protein